MPTDALTAFLTSDFPTAESTLTSLTPTTDDPRITHNLLITRFYSSLTPASLNNLIIFIASHLPNPPTTKSAFFSLASSNSSALKPLHAHLGPVPLYNAAVVAYIEGSLSAASAITNLLYTNVDAMDDVLALRLCFLMADVALTLQDIPTASNATAHAERLVSLFGKSDSSNSSQHPQLQRLAPDWPGQTTSVLEAPASYEDAKFCLHIYNARLRANKEGGRNRKEAKSAVLASDDSDSRPTAAALLVKARVEASLSKGLRILGSVGNGSRKDIIKKVRPLALNSLGVLHHRLGRHALAACYFEEARSSFALLFGEGVGKVGGMGIGKDGYVCYNLALQYMKLGEFSSALELFSAAARKDESMAETSPLLWIRMAECCVGMEKKSRTDPYSLSVEGVGRGRRLVMRLEQMDEGLAMEYASTCARGAIAILDKRKAKREGDSPKKAKKTSNLLGSRQGRVEEDTSDRDQQVAEDILLRGTALCLLAYCSLSFDPHAVINACDQLNKIYPQSENGRALLGRLYAAEALCQIGRAEEAANRLAPLLAVNDSNELNLREAACINMALSHMASGDVNAASRAAKVALKVTSSPQRPSTLRKQAGFVAAYVFLQSGEADTAKQVLKLLHSLR